jgi:hypothetical protein
MGNKLCKIMKIMKLKKIILYCGLSDKKTFIPKDTINTLNKEIIKPKDIKK